MSLWLVDDEPAREERRLVIGVMMPVIFGVSLELIGGSCHDVPLNLQIIV